VSRLSFPIRATLGVVTCSLMACSTDAPVAPVAPAAILDSPAVSQAVLVATPLLYTTLDNAAAVTRPVYGSGTGARVVSFPSNSFVPALAGGGVELDADGERVTYPQIENGVKNIELDRGTMDFWFRPNFASDDNLKYTIVGTGNWTSIKPKGSLHFGKHNKSNFNKLFLIFFDANGVRYEHNVTTADYAWAAGSWQHITITWNFRNAPGAQNLHLYLNGRELPLSYQVSRGPQLLPAEQATQDIYIGSRGLGSINADGTYDEFRIFDKVVRPS
jgi:hypothetical protein